MYNPVGGVILVFSIAIAALVGWLCWESNHNSTVVLCKGLSSEYVVTVQDFKKEADGFSGRDTKGYRQYYMKDSNDTCYTMDEELYNKGKRGN